MAWNKSTDKRSYFKSSFNGRSVARWWKALVRTDDFMTHWTQLSEALSTRYFLCPILLVPTPVPDYNVTPALRYHPSESDFQVIAVINERSPLALFQFQEHVSRQRKWKAQDTGYPSYLVIKGRACLEGVQFVLCKLVITNLCPVGFMKDLSRKGAAIFQWKTNWLDWLRADLCRSESNIGNLVIERLLPCIRIDLPVVSGNCGKKESMTSKLILWVNNNY